MLNFIWIDVYEQKLLWVAFMFLKKHTTIFLIIDD